MGLDTGRYIPSRRGRRVEKARGYECTAGLIFVEITGLKPSRERGAQRASRANMNEFMRADIATVEAQSTKGLKT